MNIHKCFVRTLAALLALAVLISASNSVSAGISPERISIAYPKDSVPSYFFHESGQLVGIIMDIGYYDRKIEVRIGHLQDQSLVILWKLEKQLC